MQHAALALAQTIASRAPLAVAAAKRAIRHAVDASLGDALEHENALFRELTATEDHKTALRAFFERTEPRFEGR